MIQLLVMLKLSNLIFYEDLPLINNCTCTKDIHTNKWPMSCLLKKESILLSLNSQKFLFIYQRCIFKNPVKEFLTSRLEAKLFLKILMLLKNREPSLQPIKSTSKSMWKMMEFISKALKFHKESKTTNSNFPSLKGNLIILLFRVLLSTMTLLKVQLLSI